MDRDSSAISFKFRKTIDVKQIQSEEAKERDFVTSIENKKIKSSSSLPSKEKKKELVIPLIKQNCWRIPDTDGKSPAETTLDDLAIKEIISETAKANEDWEQRERKDFKEVPLIVQNKIPDGYEDGDKVNVALRPNEPEIADYEKVPVEDYGLAMLRGMGWKDVGDPIGNTNKKHVAPIEAAVRPKGLGLGAGQKSTKKQHLDQGEELVLKKHSYIYVEDGQYAGAFGQVEGLDEDNARVYVKLTSNNEIVTLSELAIRVISEKEFRKESRIINKKKYEEYKTKLEDKFVTPSTDDEERKRGFVESLCCKRSEVSDEKVKDENTKKKQKHLPMQNGGEKENLVAERNVVSWVVPLLRVRFIDKNYKGGKYFNTKMIVEDMITPTRCLCKTEDNHILEDIHISMLETVIPRTERSYIMIVQGKQKGQVGAILKRDKVNCIATVQLLSDREKILKLNYDFICEYLGDISHFD